MFDNWKGRIRSTGRRRAVPCRRMRQRQTGASFGRAVPPERYRTGTAKPKRRRMRSMKAHIWDTGVFFSVLLLLITGLIAVLGKLYQRDVLQGQCDILSCVRAFFAAIGLAAMIALSKFPYRMYAGIHNIIMWISVALLILVGIPGISIDQ